MDNFTWINTDLLVYLFFVLIGLISGVVSTLLIAPQKRVEPSAKRSWAERFEGGMAGWQRITKAAEDTVLDNVAASTPWLGPVIPAALAYHNLVTYVGFPAWLAFVSALCIEFLGLSAVHTCFQLWQYNEEKRESDQDAPVAWALGTGASYILIVLVVNVILELSGVETITGQVVAIIVAKALLSLLSVVAAFVLALRSQHSRRLSEQKADKVKRQEAKELGQLRQAVPALKQKLQEAEQLIREMKQTGRVNEQKAQQIETAEAKVVQVETEKKQLAQQIETSQAQLQQVQTELKQTRTERETALKQAKQAETARQQLETEREQLAQELEQNKRILALWSALPPEIQAAAVKHVEGGSLRQLASEFGLTSHSAVDRRYKELFSTNGH